MKDMFLVSTTSQLVWSRLRFLIIQSNTCVRSVNVASDLSLLSPVFGFNMKCHMETFSTRSKGLVNKIIIHYRNEWYIEQVMACCPFCMNARMYAEERPMTNIHIIKP